MNQQYVSAIAKYAKLFSERKFIESGYVALRDEDGIVITASGANLGDIHESDLVFVNDKNIDSFDGNFRAAAVILFCAIRQDKTSEAAAIVDSDNILKFSTKRKPLMPILDEVAQLLGISVKCAARNVAAEIVTSISGSRNACFMPDAGAVVKARNLEEVLNATAVLDKACHAMLIAENGGAEVGRLNAFTALCEQVIYKLKTSKSIAASQDVPSDKQNKEQSGNLSQQDSDKQTDDKQADGNQSDGNQQTESSSDSQGAEIDKQGANDEVLGDMKELALFADDKGEEVAFILHPFYGSALSAIGKSMPVPMDYRQELGEEIPCAASAPTFCVKKTVKNVCAVIGDSAACFIAQHGVVVRGKSREEALNVCRTLEAACKEYIENK